MLSGISSVSAASGPYAAELSASRPKIGMPFSGPMRSAFSSSVASARPNSTSTKLNAGFLAVSTTTADGFPTVGRRIHASRQDCLADYDRVTDGRDGVVEQAPGGASCDSCATVI